MKVQITRPPFSKPESYPHFRPYEDGEYWPCRWISAGGEAPGVMAFRCYFDLAAPAVVRLHVTADERYELYLDGTRVARGSERGDARNWFYETWDVPMTAGAHLLVARVWALGALRPWAQVSVVPGFLLAPGDEALIPRLGTGVAFWEVLPMDGYRVVDPRILHGYGSGSGGKLEIRGEAFPWGFERGQGEGWKPAVALACGNDGRLLKPTRRVHRLRPSTLPAMEQVPVRPGVVRFAGAPRLADTRMEPVYKKRHRVTDARAWTRFLQGAPLTLKPHSRYRMIAELEGYACLYPELTVSGGQGSRIRLSWAESLFQDIDPTNHEDKGKRDIIDGKYFRGLGDTFFPDGGQNRRFDTLWWHAGRYMELVVETGEEALTLEELTLTETRYPLERQASFETGSPALMQLQDMAFRTLQLCAHETYMDCPYYEQMMYGGDTRLEALVTYTQCPDDRLPRKALHMFAASLEQFEGLTACAYPDGEGKVIPSFSLGWVSMVHDYAMWREDAAFVAGLMPGVREVMETMLASRCGPGLVVAPCGWDFTDWAQDGGNGWRDGVPPGGPEGAHAVLNWQMAGTLMTLAELEDMQGEPELASRARRKAQTLAEVIHRVFWDENRGLYADDPSHRHFSEHAQCMALLSGLMKPPDALRLFEAMQAAEGLARTSIYYTHYLFEVYRTMGRPDLLLARLAPWTSLPDMGYVTLPEYLDIRSRSDCHGWSAHPLYHFHATLMGIRPAAPGFRRVEICPQPGDLSWMQSATVHPRGIITASYRTEGHTAVFTVTLPPDTTGVLRFGGSTAELVSGTAEVRL